ncbi:uncharacterized protein [Choristoneura fumiferana]|uniref:uncharacterized protein n=1 Tax=Choristoneura fumiferana TaxID=7141 RepID=UPI003D15F0A3
MAHPVKFLSLQKSELEYEVQIRGSTPAATVQDLRKQIAKLGPLFPSEDILESSLDVNDDLRGITDVLAKVKSFLDSPLDRNALLRVQNYLHHLYHRLNRLIIDAKTHNAHETCVKEFQTLYDRFNSVKDTTVVDRLIAPVDTNSTEQQSAVPPLNINVSCDRGVVGELTRIRFDGKSCVRSFIQRINEFSKARNISSSKLLSFATEIFTGDALHWYRGIQDQDQMLDWDSLVARLKKDFDQAGYDYRLLSEIRARTQGESENITIYLSIMSGLFARLSETLPSKDKLEILLHNIRPCYASTLASATDIPDIDTLRSLCRNYENIQARLAGFREPPKRTSDTMAPEFAYSGHSSHKANNSNINYGNNFYNNNYNKNKILS